MADKIVYVQGPSIVANEPSQNPINASVSTISITATVNTPNITDSTDQSNIRVQLTGLGEESQPNDASFKRATEVVTQTDLVNKSTNKLIIDLVTQSDTFTVLMNYIRSFSESQATIELTSFAIGKNIVELASLQDPDQKLMQKVLLDALTAQEQVSKTASKLFLESQEISNIVNLLVSKQLSEVVSSTDAASTTVNYFRVFLDSVDATDDFLGEANIDDDQTARVGKNIVDYTTAQDLQYVANYITKQDLVTTQETKELAISKILVDAKILTDVLALAYAKPQQDQTSATEVFLGNIGKGLQEYVTNTDTNYKQIAKSYVDSLINTERVSKDISKLAKENVINTEVFVNAFTKVLADLTISTDVLSANFAAAKQEELVAADTKSIQFGKNNIETTVIYEVLSTVVNYYRNYEDIVDATDDFLGEANLDDDQVARVGKVVVEQILLPETLVFDLSKINADTASASERVLKYLGKYFQNISTISDSAFSKTISKPFTETSTSSDNFIRLVNFFRIPSDTATTQEMLSILVDKILETSTNSVTDSFSRIVDYIRIFANSSSTADIKYFNIGKHLEDIADTNDVAQIAKGKTLLDTFYSSESFSRVATFYRSYSDVVDATDDFLGEANLDDDQIARVGKVVVEIPTTSETIKADANKGLLDFTNLQNPISKLATKRFTDGFTRTDQLYNNPRKVQIDSVIAADVFSFNKTTNLPLLDSAITNDSGLINNQSYFAGTFSIPGYVGTNTIFS